MRTVLARILEHAGTLYVMDEGRRRKAEDGDVTVMTFRPTYITARLQTTDNGAPVSPWTVCKEVGHANLKMIEQRYGRIGEIRQRKDAVEFRIEQHADRLKDRLPLPTTSGQRRSSEKVRQAVSGCDSTTRP